MQGAGNEFDPASGLPGYTLGGTVQVNCDMWRVSTAELLLKRITIDGFCGMGENIY